MKQDKPGTANNAKPAAEQRSGLTRPGDLYVQGDALPQPDVVEKDTDSVWALWSDMVESESDGANELGEGAGTEADKDFSETVPMDLDDMEPTQLMDLPDLSDDDKK